MGLDFEDDGTVDSTEQNPTHVYEVPGVYPVRLTASNAAGSDDEAKPGYIIILFDVPDEITGLSLEADGETISWDAHPDACSYDLVKGSLPLLRSSGGDFSLSQLTCVAEDVLSNMSSDPASPATGEGFYYLVRGVDCALEAGTYDTSGLGQTQTRDPDLQGPAAVNPGVLWYADSDSDGYGNPNSSQASCTQPAGHIADNTDCDDGSSATFPGAAPNDDSGACMRDVDDDDWGAQNPPAGVTAGTDCDDNDAGSFPPC